MKTTVVIPNYNGKDYLKDCLDSLKLCQPNDFEIIVVDDCSSDGSADMIRNEYPYVKLFVHEQNGGFAASVNTGIRASVSDYVLLLNNDTKVDPFFVKKLEEAIERNDRIFSVSARMMHMDDPDIVDGAGDFYCALGWAFAHNKDVRYTGKDRPREVFSACAGAAIYRRDTLNKLGLFDERHFAYLEDVDIGYRARIYGYINMYEPEAVCLHVGSASSGSRYNEFKIKLSSRNSTYIICKNMPILQQLINLPFFVAGFGIKFLFFAAKGYGLIYLKGLFEGIGMGYGAEGRKHRVHAGIRHLTDHIRIQLQLWTNISRLVL